MWFLQPLENKEDVSPLVESSLTRIIKESFLGVLQWHREGILSHRINHLQPIGFVYPSSDILVSCEIARAPSPRRSSAIGRPCDLFNPALPHDKQLHPPYHHPCLGSIDQIALKHFPSQPLSLTLAGLRSIT